MRKNILRILAVGSSLFFPIIIFADTTPDTAKRSKILKQAYINRIPFIKNIGQIKDEDVSFYAKIFGGRIFIERDGVLIYNSHAKDQKSIVIKEIFTNKNKSTKPEGLEPSPTRVTYLIGKDKMSWGKNIPSYKSISFENTYENIYKDIDIKLEAHGNNIEKFFYVKPNTNPENIKIEIDGAKGLSMNEKGPWTQKVEGATKRADHSCVVYNDKMYIFGGGCNVEEANIDDLWEYSFIEDSWSSKGNAPVKRAPSGVVYNGKMYIFGGAGDDIADTEEAKELWAYDFMNEVWEEKTSGPCALSLYTAIVYNEKMYVFGGEIANSGQGSDRLWEYDFANDIWSLKSTASRSFIHHSAVICDDKMYVFGGIFPGPYSCDSNNNDDDINSHQLWEYDFNTNNWEHIGDAPFSRSEHTALVYNGKMYIFGGGTFYLDQFCEGSLVESNALWKYNFSKNSWSRIENIGAWPNSRAGHSSVVYNHKMYIFGGGIFADFSDPECFNDLWEYDLEFYVPFADYFPTTSEKYGIKAFKWTFGKTGQFTRRIEGTETVPYKSGEITGAKITNYFDSNSGIIFNDGVNVKFLGTEDYYISTDCSLTGHPSEFSFNTLYDGMIINQREYYSINKNNLSDCEMDGNQMLLISIQDVTVLGGNYKNAVIMWYLDTNYPCNPCTPSNYRCTPNFHGKELDLGIALPTCSDTMGYSVTGFDVIGYETGPITSGDIDASTGDLEDLSELMDIVIEISLPAGWSMVSLPVIPNSSAIDSLFPGAVVAYGYEKEGYARAEELEAGDGYWILLDQNQTFTLIGQPIRSYYRTGNKPTNGNHIWDMVGGCTYMARPKGDSCSICVIYRYVQGSGYVRIPKSELLKPGKGYWIQLKDIVDQYKLTVEAISLNGVWFWHGSEKITSGSEEYNIYFIADDNEVLTDFGVFCFESGSYRLLPDGSFTLKIIEPVQYCEGETHIAKGGFTSFTEGFIFIDLYNERRIMEKINDLSVCEGTWNGTLVENDVLHTEYDITITVDSEGVITSSDGDFAPPVRGRMFGKSNDIIAFLRTGEPQYPGGYNEMKINATMAGNSIKGKYINDLMIEGTIDLIMYE